MKSANDINVTTNADRIRSMADLIESQAAEIVRLTIANKMLENDNYNAEMNLSHLTDDLTAAQRRERDARNELCQRCGRYREAHKGACDGCRWKE